MKGTIIILFNAAILLILFNLLARPGSRGRNLWRKAVYLFRLGLLRLDLGFARTVQNIRLAMEQHFKGYEYSAVRAAAVREKERHLETYKRQLREAPEGHAGKEKYKRKILQ